MAIIVFALILGFDTIWAITCGKYQCSTSASLCMTQSGQTITIDSTVCTNNTYCVEYEDSNGNVQGSCEAITNEDRLPGGKCTKDSECYEESCVNNVCEGRASGAECNNRKQCDVGLYCDYDEEVCKTLKGAGDDCSYDWECNYGYGCEDVSAKCTKYFSIAVGSTQEVSCGDGFSSYCESGSCADNDKICIDPYSYESGDDIVECSSESDCKGTSGDYTNVFSCNCGYNPDGKAYCDLLTGSSYFEEYISYYKGWMTSSTAKKSHRTEKMAQNLLDYGSTSELEDYVKNTVEGYLAPYFYNAEDCAIYYVTGEFYDYYSSSSFALIAGLSVLVIS